MVAYTALVLQNMLVAKQVLQDTMSWSMFPWRRIQFIRVVLVRITKGGMNGHAPQAHQDQTAMCCHSALLYLAL